MAESMKETFPEFFPVESHEYRLLRDTVDSLRKNLSSLILEHDELAFVVCKNIETAYLASLGSLEYQLFELNVACRRLKRKINLIQAGINRQEMVNLEKIDDILDAEFSSFKKELEKKIAEIKNSRFKLTLPRMTEENFQILKKLYRQIVKRCHPDLNPDLDSGGKRVLQAAMDAYACGDLVTLRCLAATLPSANETCAGDTLSELQKTKAKLEKAIDDTSSRIEKILTSYPYLLKDILEDELAYARKKKELEDRIVEATGAQMSLLGRLTRLLESWNVRPD